MNSENVWRKRVTKKLECPSGNVILVRRPGPDLALKCGKMARILHKYPEAKDPTKMMEILEGLPDDELEGVMAYARVLIADVVIDPPLVLHPKEGQLGPDDVPLLDFWHIFDRASRGFPDMPVKLKEGETTIEAVQNFPTGEESGLGLSDDSGPIQQIDSGDIGN